jgi:hypothetical protein
MCERRDTPRSPNLRRNIKDERLFLFRRILVGNGPSGEFACSADQIARMELINLNDSSVNLEWQFITFSSDRFNCLNYFAR